MKKSVKKIISVLLCVVLIAACFAGCSSSGDEKYSDTSLIIGYVPDSSPFITVDKDGKVGGFEADVIEKIFKSIKGDFKSYVFEDITKVEGYERDPYSYELEHSGGFFDSKGGEYSAALLVGAVSKNHGTFNEDYSFTEPLITDRVIAVTAKNSAVKTYSDLSMKNVAVCGKTAQTAFGEQKTISDSCKITNVDKIDDALKMIENGTVDAVITDEFLYMPSGRTNDFKVLDGEIDTIEYVIACAKYSGWYTTINEAIREFKSEDYGDGDEFTPIVKKYFKYNASKFDYKTEGDA